MRPFHIGHFFAGLAGLALDALERPRPALDLVMLPLASAAHFAADVGAAMDRRARVWGVSGRECDACTCVMSDPFNWCVGCRSYANSPCAREPETAIAPRVAWPVAPGVLQGPIEVGDTFTHPRWPGVAWEVTDKTGDTWILRSEIGFPAFPTTEILLNPEGPWKRSVARAVTERGAGGAES